MKKFPVSILLVCALSMFPCVLLKTDAYALDDSTCLIPISQSVSPDFQDLERSWCRDYVRICCQAGLLRGKTADSFDEKSQLTNAQITVITARLYEKLTGAACDLDAEQDEPWYFPSYEFLKTIMPDVMQREMYLDSPFMPDRSNDPCSRMAFAEMLAGVLQAAEVQLPAKNEISSIPDTTNPNVQMLYRAGVLAGSDPYGFFHGSASLTRGQAAAMLARLVDTRARMDVTLEPFDFFEQVFGISSDTALLSVDNRAITANACGGSLFTLLLREITVDGRAPAEAIKFLAADYCRDVAAPLSLAADWNISLTQEEQDSALLSARAASGYMGRNTDSWYQEFCQEKLIAKAERYCESGAAPDGVFYRAAVNAKCDELLVETTAAFQALDAESIYDAYLRFFS